MPDFTAHSLGPGKPGFLQETAFPEPILTLAF
jgi:hypothetical protein